MNWKNVVGSLVHPKSVINAALIFLACYGAAALLHLPGASLLALVAVVSNQIGLQQAQPGA